MERAWGVQGLGIKRIRVWGSEVCGFIRAFMLFSEDLSAWGFYDSGFREFPLALGNLFWIERFGLFWF